MAMFVRVADHGLSRHHARSGSRSSSSSPIASMVLGSFAAIGQRNIKRLMAYSSIGHMGFALVGLAAGTAEGVQGVLVYMAIYVAMTLGTFAVHPRDAPRRTAWSRTSAISPASRARSRPWRSSSRCCCSRWPASRRSPASSPSSTCSSPPSRPGSIMLAVIGVLASVVGAYYYLRHRQDHVFRRAGRAVRADAGRAQVVLAVCGCSTCCSSSIRRRWSRGDRRREVAVLMRAFDRRRSRPAIACRLTTRSPRPIPRR